MGHGAVQTDRNEAGAQHAILEIPRKANLDQALQQLVDGVLAECGGRRLKNILTLATYTRAAPAAVPRCSPRPRRVGHHLDRVEAAHDARRLRDRQPHARRKAELRPEVVVEGAFGLFQSFPAGLLTGSDSRVQLLV